MIKDCLDRKKVYYEVLRMKKQIDFMQKKHIVNQNQKPKKLWIQFTEKEKTKI